jgi:hypothetical protein
LSGKQPEANVTIPSRSQANHLRTVLKFQRIATQRSFNAGEFPGRTVGLDAEAGQQETAGQ